MTTIFKTKVKIYGNAKVQLVVKKMKEKISKAIDIIACVDIFYGSRDFANKNYQLDAVRSIGIGGEEYDIEIAIDGDFPFNFLDHLTACLMQVDENVVVTGRSYVDGIYKGAFIYRASWYDEDRASNEYFFNNRLSKNLIFQNNNKRFFYISFACGFIGKGGVQTFTGGENYMMEGTGVYKPIEFYELEQSSSEKYPLNNGYDIEFNLDQAAAFTNDNFIEVVKRFATFNKSFRVVLAKNKYPFFKELCDVEENAYFIVSCEDLPYCDEECLECEVDKSTFKYLMDGGYQIHEGENFITYGDIATNTWFFNYGKENHLKVDYNTHGKSIKLFSGKLSDVAASIVED